ncbi:MAG TPA: ribosomal protein S18-alanine N-acetyltransferase [Clostridiales bacterium]|nr:ribosomal protein S18-alanine N-acetyltransferase [Clostridiales bacterium]
MKTVRELTEEYADILHQKECEIFGADAWSKSAFLSSFESEYCKIFGIFADDVLSGYGVIYDVAGEIEIVNIAIFPEYRRKGLGEELLKFILKIPADKYVLQVRVSNIPAKNLYEKHGFENVTRIRDFYENPTEDAFLLIRC